MTDPVQAVAEAMRTHLWSHAARSCSCGWEQKRKGGAFLRQWTEHVAEAAVAAARPLIAAEALREAGGWLDSFEGPGGRQSAYDRAGRDVIRLLRARADDLEAGR